MKKKERVMNSEPAAPKDNSIETGRLAMSAAAKDGSVNATVPFCRELTVDADMARQRRCEQALELFVTHRGNPAAEIDRVVVDDPHCVFAHCLRAALIVRDDDGPSLAQFPSAAAAPCQ
jgi:hypothetical protein